MLSMEAADAFIEALGEKRYYDAHEVLEVLWFPHRASKTPEVLLLKGLINAATAFELHKRGRTNKAPNPWKTYLRYRVYLPQMANPRYRRLAAAVEQIAHRLKLEDPQ